MTKDKSLSIYDNEYINLIFDKIDNSQNIAFICHDTPDPDCIGPASALAEYCVSKGISYKIFYGGNISHLQNKALVNVLNISLTRFQSILDSYEGEEEKDAITIVDDYITTNFDLVILLDTSSYGGKGNVKMCQVIPDIIIDHHQEEIDINGDADKIKVLNKKCGSTSSIITSMFKSKDIDISNNAATSLFIGLMTDTNFLTSSNVDEIDHEANNYLLQHVDFALYTRVMNFEMPEELLKVKSLAYSDKYFFRKNTLAIVGTGCLRPEFKDLTAIIADEVIRIEGIQKVVAISILEDRNDLKYIIASIRTSGDTTNTTVFAKSIFGSNHAGAKRGSGGAFLPLDCFSSSLMNVDKTKFFDLVYDHYKKIILDIHADA
ncbi:MAG: DHH family phosphoesterase [Bacillota bacterium]